VVLVKKNSFKLPQIIYKAQKAVWSN